MLPDDIESVLDVSCINGPVPSELAKPFPFMVGLDIASSLLKYVRPLKKAEEGDAICPQCGNGNHFVYWRNLFARRFWSIPMRILPLSKRPRWMVALYKKNTA